MQIAIFILAVILFVGLVVVHEFGHYLVARRNGVDVEEFGIGFPPRAWKKKLKNGMIFSLNWLPLGGFVKLKGESDSATEKGSFGAASVWAKTKILLAGVAMNLLTGLVLLTILAVVGMPVLIDKGAAGAKQYSVASDTKIINQQVDVGGVVKDSPAYEAGLKGTDILLSIASASEKRELKTAEGLNKATAHFAGQKITLTYKRAGVVYAKDIQLLDKAEVEASNGAKGYLGTASNDLTIQRSTWSAPIAAVGFTAQLTKLTIVGLGHALSGLGSAIAGVVSGNHSARENGQAKASSQVGGPVAVMSILWNSGSLGLNFMLAFIAVISLTLVIMNILPIPGLDGGRLLMILTSRVLLKRPLSRATEEKIVGTGIVLLMGLILLITIVDVKRSF